MNQLEGTAVQPAFGTLQGKRSTLRRYLKSLGLTLELSVVDQQGERIDLPCFLPWQDAGPATNDAAAPYRVEPADTGTRHQPVPASRPKKP